MPDQLCTTKRHHPGRGVLQWERKLNRVISDMESCKTALAGCRLAPSQSAAASHVLLALEKGIDELGSSISTHLSSFPEGDGEVESIDLQLDELGRLCEKLTMTILSRRRAQQRSTAMEMMA